MFVTCVGLFWVDLCLCIRYGLLFDLITFNWLVLVCFDLLGCFEFILFGVLFDGCDLGFLVAMDLDTTVWECWCRYAQF